jgi:hypothetical protein
MPSPVSLGHSYVITASKVVQLIFLKALLWQAMPAMRRWQGKLIIMTLLICELGVKHFGSRSRVRPAI